VLRWLAGGLDRDAMLVQLRRELAVLLDLD
jgi:hypothetical protein